MAFLVGVSAAGLLALLRRTKDEEELPPKPTPTPNPGHVHVQVCVLHYVLQ